MARRPRPTEENPTFSPQHLVTLLRASVPPVHPAGLPFISAGLIAALGGAAAEALSEASAKRKYRWLRRGGVLAAGACAMFFRHPPRVPPTRPGTVVAPADGVVCVVDSAAPPPELNMGAVPLPRVSIFLSVFDAHVQRAPVGGEVIDVQHQPGRFGSADLAAASTDNERTSLRIRTPDGVDVVAVQIAGLVARRIVCKARVGDTLSIGDTYGLIRFGSRLDTYLPPTAAPLVTVGQRTVAGETILAQLS